eukprot:scaffold55903_cov36-Tisochrysis_lutea.AAC.2
MVMGEAEEKRLELLKLSLEQARSGSHTRIVAEEKRLKAQQAEKLTKAENLRDFRLNMVQVLAMPNAAACLAGVQRLPPPPRPSPAALALCPGATM